MEFLIPLTKVDEEKRLIYGRAIHEVPDRSGEIVDYSTAKGAFETWSKEFEVMSGGLSKGNLRSMHGKNVAGKIVDLSYKDEEKAIDVVAKVVDDVEWKKVLEGCYTGFSVGGSYLRKWKDGNLTRYTPKVVELSLVDNPCIPTAKFFDLVKGEGITQVAFQRPSFVDVVLRARGDAVIQPTGGKTPGKQVIRKPPHNSGERLEGVLSKWGRPIDLEKWNEHEHPRDSFGRFTDKVSSVAGAAASGGVAAWLGAKVGRIAYTGLRVADSPAAHKINRLHDAVQGAKRGFKRASGKFDVIPKIVRGVKMRVKAGARLDSINRSPTTFMREIGRLSHGYRGKKIAGIAAATLIGGLVAHSKYKSLMNEKNEARLMADIKRQMQAEKLYTKNDLKKWKKSIASGEKPLLKWTKETFAESRVKRDGEGQFSGDGVALAAGVAAGVAIGILGGRSKALRTVGRYAAQLLSRKGGAALARATKRYAVKGAKATKKYFEKTFLDGQKTSRFMKSTGKAILKGLDKAVKGEVAAVKKWWADTPIWKKAGAAIVIAGFLKEGKDVWSSIEWEATADENGSTMGLYYKDAEGARRGLLTQRTGSDGTKVYGPDVNVVAGGKLSGADTKITAKGKPAASTQSTTGTGTFQGQTVYAKPDNAGFRSSSIETDYGRTQYRNVVSDLNLDPEKVSVDNISRNEALTPNQKFGLLARKLGFNREPETNILGTNIEVFKTVARRLTQIDNSGGFKTNEDALPYVRMIDYIPQNRLKGNEREVLRMMVTRIQKKTVDNAARKANVVSTAQTQAKANERETKLRDAALQAAENAVKKNRNPNMDLSDDDILKLIGSDDDRPTSRSLKFVHDVRLRKWGASPGPFDESKIKRQPKGSDKGGEFADKPEEAKTLRDEAVSAADYGGGAAIGLMVNRALRSTKFGRLARFGINLGSGAVGGWATGKAAQSVVGEYKPEKRDLKEDTYRSIGGLVGSTVGGVVGGAAGLVGGPVGAVGGSVAGEAALGIAGEKIGSKIYEWFGPKKKKPASPKGTYGKYFSWLS